MHDVAERIAEQVCETEERLQHYVQFELIKAAVCIKNVSEKLAAYAERNGRAATKQKPPEVLLKGEKVSLVSFVPAWANESLANTESEAESASEVSDVRPGSIRQRAEQPQVPTDLDPNSPPPASQSKMDEPPYECRGRSVFVEGSNRPAKVRGSSLPDAPRRYFHWKQTTQDVVSEETPLVGRSSPLEGTARGRAKGFSRRSSRDSQDWLAERRNHLPPDSRDSVLARHRSPSPNCRHSSAYERQGRNTWHHRRHSLTPPEEVHAGRPCSHSEYRLPVIGTILPHYDSVQTRNMKKRQDHNMRQLFGL